MKRAMSSRLPSTIWITSQNACNATRADHGVASSRWKVSGLESSGNGDTGYGRLRYDANPIFSRGLPTDIVIVNSSRHIPSSNPSRLARAADRRMEVGLGASFMI